MKGADLCQPRPFAEWHEDHGDVLWWRFPVSEPPYVGTPLDLGFPIGAQLHNQFGELIGQAQGNVGGWPFSADEEALLWWTRLPDAKLIEERARS